MNGEMYSASISLPQNPIDWMLVPQPFHGSALHWRLRSLLQRANSVKQGLSAVIAVCNVGGPVALPYVAVRTTRENHILLMSKNLNSNKTSKNFDTEQAQSWSKPIAQTHYRDLIVSPPSKIKPTSHKRSFTSQEELELKLKVNRMEQENTRLKTANQRMKNDNLKLSNISKEVYGYLDKHGACGDLMLTLLKRENVDLKQKLNETQSLLLQKSKNLKLTQKEEIVIEMKNFIAETIRLKAVIKSMNRPIPSIQQHHLQLLHQQIQQLKGKLRQSEYDRDNINSKTKIYQKQIEAQKKTISKLESDLQLSIQESNKLLYYNKAIFVRNTHDQRSQSLATDLQKKQELQKACEKYKQQIVTRDETISELRNKTEYLMLALKQLEHKMHQQQHKLKAEITTLREQLNRQQEESETQLKSIIYTQHKKPQPKQSYIESQKINRGKRPISIEEAKKYVSNILQPAQLFSDLEGLQQIGLLSLRQILIDSGLDEECATALLRYINNDQQHLNYQGVLPSAYVKSAIKRLLEP